VCRGKSWKWQIVFEECGMKRGNAMIVANARYANATVMVLQYSRSLLENLEHSQVICDEQQQVVV